MVYLIVSFAICLVLLILIYKFAGITFGGLPVLMYHKVIDSGIPGTLEISLQQLDRQFNYLVKKNYTPIFLSDLLAHVNEKKILPPKPILLTFDDGYKNNYTFLYPLLEKYDLRANIFLVAGFIQPPKNNKSGEEEFLHVDEIQKMSIDRVQFGLHSYDHKSYDDLTISEIEEDIRSCRKRLEQLKIPYQPCLAYTYGAYPKKDSKKRNQMFRTMQAGGVQAAFRIGNRVNKLPIMNRLLLQRIDIKGNESFNRFRLILVTGKKILFK